MQRDPAVVMAKYNFYVEQKRRGVMKMNTESSESYDNTDLSTNTHDDDEIILTTDE